MSTPVVEPALGGPEESVPPESVPPESVPPESVPPESVPPESVPPASSSGPASPGPAHRGDGVILGCIVAVEYAIVASLLLVATVVLVRTVADFLESTSGFPQSVIPGVDGILVVIILLDIVHTVFRHLRHAAFPVRPFLVIGILAGVRDILSASAHLTLSTNLSAHNFDQTLIELGVGVGVVVLLLAGLFILSRTGYAELDE